jgi:hypothetical protein
MRSSLALLLCGAFACGPMAGHETTPTGGGSGSGSGSGSGKAAAPGDVTFDVPSIDIKGVIFEPQAIYAPAMMLIEAKKKVTLEKQRDVYAKTKDATQKQAQAAVLATMLYDKSKSEKDDAAKAKWWTEALQVLRDAEPPAGGKDTVDDITYRLEGRYTLLLNDYAGAEKAWSALVTQFPKEKDIADSRAWWAYSLLMQYKNAEAVEVLKADQPSEKSPELSYVIGWAKFRAGDSAGAFRAMVLADKGWGADRPAREAVERDLYLFAGRGVPLADSTAALTPLFGKNPDQQFDLLVRLGGEAYQFAGRWADGIAAIEKAITALGADKLPPEAAPKLRYAESSYALRLDDPASVTKYGKLTLDALSACAAKCTKDKEALVETVVSHARLLYVLYATAHDDRYYQPAHDLYLAVMPFLTGTALEKGTLEESTNLESFKKAMKPTDGTHAKDQIARLLDLHDQEVQACYELGLATNPKIGGTLVVHLESDQTGVVKGASTDPKGGAADMALVASCVADRAKQWRLPKIANGTGPAHTTRIKLTYSLAPRPRAGAGTAGAPAAAGGGAAAK